MDYNPNRRSLLSGGITSLFSLPLMKSKDLDFVSVKTAKLQAYATPLIGEILPKHPSIPLKAGWLELPKSIDHTDFGVIIYTDARGMFYGD